MMRNRARLLALACALAVAACEIDADEDPIDGAGLLLQVCGELVDRGHAGRCGTEDASCGDPAEEGCIQLGCEDAVVGPDNEVNPDTEDLPRDMAALFAMIEFLPPEAADAITPTGTITWGDPGKAGEPFLEIDQDSGDYRIDSRQMPDGMDPQDETLEESYYEEDVQRFFSPMGVAAGQTLLSINAIMGSSQGPDGNQTTVLYNRIAFVYRVINQVPVRSNKLIFDYNPDDGRLLRITGDWSPLDFANSQFSVEQASLNALVDDLIAELGDKGVTPDEIGYLSLEYDTKEGSAGKTLDLLLEVGVGRTMHGIDI